MSDQNKINIQPVLDTKTIQEQLNKQKYRINVDVDTSQISNQIQSCISQITGNIKPAKVPLEFNTDNLKAGLTTFNDSVYAIDNIKNLANGVSKSLD